MRFRLVLGGVGLILLRPQLGCHNGLFLLQQLGALFRLPRLLFRACAVERETGTAGDQARPTMTISFRPRRPSRLPMLAASVSTRVGLGTMRPR
jgi:hypothetical protein